MEELHSSKNKEDEIPESRLSPLSKEVNADEASGELDAEEETPPVPTTQETNVDDGSETEKLEADTEQNIISTRGRDLTGSDDQTEPEAAQNITPTRGRDLSGSEDQTEVGHREKRREKKERKTAQEQKQAGQ